MDCHGLEVCSATGKSKAMLSSDAGRSVVWEYVIVELKVASDNIVEKQMPNRSILGFVVVFPCRRLNQYAGVSSVSIKVLVSNSSFRCAPKFSGSVCWSNPGYSKE